MNKNFKVNPLHGIIIFSVTILFFLLVAPIQSSLGIIGVGITEVGLLFIAVISAFILKSKLRDVFPYKVPSFKQVIGTLVIWLSFFLMTAVAMQIFIYFYPDSLDVNRSIQKFITSYGYLVSMFFVAVMPAICEEALHRGIILYTFKSVKNRNITILAMGIIFGIFHMSAVRFLPTAILGEGLTYVMLISNNFLLPVLFHFFNNALSVTTAFLISNNTPYVNINLASIGIYLVMLSITPVLLIIGTQLVNKDSNSYSRRKKKLIYILSLMIFIVGFITFSTNVNTALPVLNSAQSKTIFLNQNNELSDIMHIKSEGTYKLQMDVMTSRGVAVVSVYDSEKNEVYSDKGQVFSIDCEIKLKTGLYTIVNRVYFKKDKSLYEPLGYDYNSDFVKNFNLADNENESCKLQFKILVDKKN